MVYSNLDSYVWDINNVKFKFMIHNESSYQNIAFNPQKSFHSHFYYEILFSDVDSCHLYFADKNFSLVKNSFAVIHPGYMHRAGVNGKRDILSIGFLYYNHSEGKAESDSDLFSALESVFGSKSYIIVPPMERFSSAFKLLKDMDQSSQPFATETMFAIFLQIVFGMLSAFQSPDTDIEIVSIPCENTVKHPSLRVPGDILEKINNILSTEYMTDVTAGSLSQKLYISEKQINRHIFNQYSQTFQQRKTFLRINSACELLTQTDKSISEICKAVGYTSINTFYSAFKIQTGLTPNEFRIYYSDKQKSQYWV
ncbi:MAG: helix-turn-helix domain-containing protein [Eubacteriales bacterium]